MREGVLAREIKIEGFRASGRAEDAPYTAGADEAASPNPSGQGALRILPAAHRCPWGPPAVGWWSVGGRLAFLRSLLRSELVPSPCSTLASSALWIS